MKRTYYCFQMGFQTYPAGEVIASTQKPKEMRGVWKIRAETSGEAEEKYREEWDKSCQEALMKEESAA